MLSFIVFGTIILLLLIIVFQLRGLKAAPAKEPAHRKFEVLANMLSIAVFENKGTIEWSDNHSFELYDSTNPSAINIIYFRFENGRLRVTWKIDLTGANPIVLQREYNNLTDTSWSKQESIAKDLTEAMNLLNSN
jgi:hypothetical protein